MGPLSKVSTYFNVQFESVKGEVRERVAHLHGLLADQAAAQDRRRADEIHEVTTRLDAVEQRLDELSRAVAELRATNDRLLAVAASWAEAPVTTT